MSLREMLSDYWYAFQQELFPRLESELGPMGERYELFVAVLELVRVEALLPYFRGQVGRPEEDRAALARAFIAKAVFDVPTTRALIERLCCKLGEGAMRDQGASCSPYDSALARRSCSHAMASVRAHGPRSKARSTIRASPTMPPWRANIPAWPLRSARITSKPLIVA